jgi:2-iminobutanoate/2-iminopropanoate deaminase
MNVQELLAEVGTAPVVKRAITNHSALNEAYDYGSAFSRGMRIDLNGLTILLISGTASIDDAGRTVHVGDLRGQMRRTFDNISKLLASEGATWHDIVRTTCYLRDIERDYQAFNEERTRFYKEQGLDPLPASTGIQAILCRPDLLVEIEAIAMSGRNRRRSSAMRLALVSVAAAVLACTASGQVSAPCACGKNPPGPPAPRSLKPYTGAPEDLVHFRSSRNPITSTIRTSSNTTALRAMFQIRI